MNTFQKPLKQAQRRLWLNRWLAALGWSLTGAAGLFIAATVIQRLWIPPEVAGSYYLILLSALAGTALLVSIIWTAATRESLVNAAARLDSAANLKERLSSGLYCRTSADPFAQAVVADAERTGRGLPVKRFLPVRLADSAGYAGGSLVAALLLFLLLPTVDLSGQQSATEEERKREESAQRAQAMVKPLLQQEIRRLGKANPDLQRELEALEPLENTRLETPLDVRREAMKQVEKIADKLQSHRNSNEMAKVDELRKMMRRLANQQKSQSPVGELAQALARGDFKSAQEAVQAIQQELAKTPATPEEQQRAEELKQQLAQLSEKLNQLAQEDRRSQEDLRQAGLNDEEIKKALEQAQKGDTEGLKQQLAEKGLSQQQIEQLAQQLQQRAEASSAASQLAQSLAAAAASGMGELSQSGMDGLTAAGDQLSEMESLQQQLNQLSASLSDLQGMKDRLGQGCAACQGTGMQGDGTCGGCQGTGMGPGGQGSGMGSLGQGEGGVAPLQQTDFRTVQRKADVNTLPGRIISQQFIDGEQYKGEVSDEFREAAIAAERDITDAIARERIPRPIQGAVGKYFTRTFGELADEPASDPANEAP